MNISYFEYSITKELPLVYYKSGGLPGFISGGNIASDISSIDIDYVFLIWTHLAYVGVVRVIL